MNAFIQKLFTRLSTEDAKRIGLPLAVFKAKIRNDWWLFGDEAVKNRVVTDTVEVTCERALTEKRETDRVYFWFGTYDITYSGCPLASAPLEIKQVTKASGLVGADAAAARFLQRLNPRQYLMDRFTQH